jgi:hypothetical protein
MATNRIKFRDWEFEVDKDLTEKTYLKTPKSGSDTCDCLDCKNYIEYREKVFPEDVIQLFDDLGVDYKKEVEVTHWDISNGICLIAGWFHFKGSVLSGKNCYIPSESGGFHISLTELSNNFSIGFGEGNALTFFENTSGLVQIEFQTSIPWVIDDKS